MKIQRFLIYGFILTCLVYVTATFKSYASELPQEETVQETETTPFTEPTPTDVSDPTADFVTRMYEVILGRQPDPQGLADWVRVLKNHETTGSEVARDFIFSDEFLEKNYSHEQYVELLYTSVLGRPSDQEGLDAWVSLLNDGFTRLHVCSGFIGSDEFTQLCDTYGIVRGSIASDAVVDNYPNITKFVARLYRLILSRSPEHVGLTDWVDSLRLHENTAAQVISGFVNSQEFQSKQMSDEDYVKVLYRTILGREADPEGLATWLGNLDCGMSRTFILYHFVYSQEFTDLCSEYEVVKGEIALIEPRDQNKDLTIFVNTAFKNSLGRPGTPDELNTWCQKLIQKTVYGKDFLESLFFSSELNAGKLKDDAFANVLYATMLQRTPTENEKKEIINIRKASGDQGAFIHVAKTDEFCNLLKNLGLFARYYQNPSQYYQIQNSIKPLTGGGYDLKLGYMGVKVYMVQQKLGLIYPGSRAIVDNNFMTMVKYFQQSHGLTADGIVGLKTWKAMGFSEEDWYNAGTYISPILVNETSTREDCIEAMISTAYTYLGTPYVIGAAGKPGSAIDCSGLVMQGLYAAGMDLSPINPIRHSQPGYEYESRNMWASNKFLHVDYKDRQRGDLIFYQNAYGTIIHVAIYLGDDQVIEAWPDKTVIWPIKNSHRSNIAGVARPFV